MAGLRRRRAGPVPASSPGSCARPAPMLPMRFFRSRAFAAANVTALLMYAALFGALFLVTQLLQTGLGATPWRPGCACCRWR